MDEPTITETARTIRAAPSDDGIAFSFGRIGPIRKDDEYANLRVHVRASCDRIFAALKVDATTGTPSRPLPCAAPTNPSSTMAPSPSWRISWRRYPRRSSRPPSAAAKRTGAHAT